MTGQTISSHTEVAVIGAGPGGYVAALRLADLGKNVLLIEEKPRLGGTCLLEGCIPSKALIHAVDLCHQARSASKIGLTFSDPKLDLEKLREWTGSVVQTLSQGVTSLIEKRKIRVMYGKAVFTSPHTLVIDSHGDVTELRFENCIIATGSRINELPAAFNQPVWSSEDALKLPEIPESLLVIGGGFIGLEIGLVYAGLGSKVTIAEFFPKLLPVVDHDLVTIMVRQVSKRLEEILLDSKVIKVEESPGGFNVDLEIRNQMEKRDFQQVLVAVGRVPNTDGIQLENTGLSVNNQWKIPVDSQCRTGVPHIFAIGDIVPGPMLAHKATREGKIAAEVIAGHSSSFDNRAIPAAVFTDPEIAWTGITEKEAKEQNIPVSVGRFPLTALGRAWTLGRTDGLVKIISDPETRKVLGVGMVGPQASELISEGTLALELGATLKDLMTTIHPHPTLSEAIMEAAEVAAGSPIHISPRQKK